MKRIVIALVILALVGCGSNEPPEWDAARDIPVYKPVIHYAWPAP
jgi:hypothetical protein